jgi:flagellar hook-length control protein FliK
MADNTISPVVPNVSGGRTVSTGQKAITQTTAQSGIDFKSYLGGRTAVQDNSTTFLKQRNSYTLNKNNTKEISIKTASKNSPTESEVKKITHDISSQIVEKVTDDLDISEDELNNAMQLLGLTAMDLLNPANLAALYCEVTGNASDPQALVLNADFTALFNDVSQVASENDAQLDLLSQLTASDDGEILDADIVSSADTTDTNESTGSVNTPEKTVDSSYDDTAASGQNINDTADEAVKVYDGSTQDSSYQNSDEGTSSGETGNGITSDENTEKTQSKSQVDSSFDDSGERVLHHEDGAHSDNSVLHASVSEQLNTDTSFEMSQSQSRLRVDTTDIIRQIVDSMSISNTTEESAINLQLTPESLGRMYINVSQKNSEISARIAVSNEAVKEALQTQMVNLKEALNNSGIRVNELEITVASHEFERNLEQGAANDSRQQESTNSYNGSNSSDSGTDSDMMQDRAEERLVTQIMRDNGNSVDFTA